MIRLTLFRLLRTLVTVRDWLCLTFVTKEELKQLLYENQAGTNARIMQLVAQNNEHISAAIDERLQNYPAIVPEIADNSEALRMSLYKYLIHSDQIRQSFLHDLMALNGQKLTVRRIDDVGAITRIEVADAMGALVSVLRVILRYTNPLYLSMEAAENSRWKQRQTQYRREFVGFLYQMIVISGRQIDRHSFYIDVKYALKKEGIKPIDFLLS